MSYPRRIATSGQQAVAQKMAEHNKRLRAVERATSHEQQRGTAFDPSTLTITRDAVNPGTAIPPDFTSGPFVDVNIPHEDALVAVYMQFNYADGGSAPGAATMLWAGVEDHDNVWGFATRGMSPLILVDNSSGAAGNTGIVATGTGDTFGSAPTIWTTGRQGYAHPPWGDAKILTAQQQGLRRYTMSYYWASGNFTNNPTLTVWNRWIQVSVL